MQPARSSLFVLLSVLILSALGAAGCLENLPPVPPPPPPPFPPPGTAVVVADPGPDAVPHVIRRVLGEERELIVRSQALAEELSDPTGRARAHGELDAMSDELERFSTGLDQADSDRLDAIARRLGELETRIALVHEALRTATSRTTAVEIDTAR
jgi:hypothetical protein